MLGEMKGDVVSFYANQNSIKGSGTSLFESSSLTFSRKQENTKTIVFYIFWKTGLKEIEGGMFLKKCKKQEDGTIINSFMINTHIYFHSSRNHCFFVILACLSNLDNKSTPITLFL